MADTTPATSGTSTSEFKLTTAAMVLGAVLEGVATVLHTLQDSGISAPWFSVALVALGAVIQVASLFGYQKSRTLVKAALIAADSPSPKPPSP